MVERLAGPRGEGRGDAQQRAVGVLQQECRRSGVPRGVAARLERRADAPGRKRRGVRLALDQLAAGELGDRRAVSDWGVEGVVLLRGGARQRLKPVRVVGRALLQCPLLHRLRHRIGQRGVERLAALQRPLERLVHILRQTLALDDRAEHVGREHLVARQGQVGRAERRAVRAPLCCCDVLLTCPGHGGLLSSSSLGWATARPAQRQTTSPTRAEPHRRPLRVPPCRTRGENGGPIFRHRAK